MLEADQRSLVAIQIKDGGNSQMAAIFALHSKAVARLTKRVLVDSVSIQPTLPGWTIPLPYEYVRSFTYKDRSG